MRIALVARLDMSKSSGVVEKYRGMVDAWREQGHEVQIFVIRATESSEQPLPNDLKHGKRYRLPEKNRAKAIHHYFLDVRQLAVQIRRMAADIVYMRDLTFAPGLISIMRNVPTVLELNTVNRREKRVTASRPFWLYRMFTEPLTFRLSSGMIAVTQEIADTVAHYRRPTCVIPNGFDLNSVNTTESPTAPRKSMIFVGTPGWPWHGTDKIFDLAKGMPDWQFQIIGYTAEQLSPLSGLSNLKAYGLLAPQDYADMLASSSMAIGTLALHRIDMHESCSLKVREYLAHGLPVLLGNRDSDFNAPTWFLKVLQNYEGNVADNIGDIQKFADSVVGRRVPRSEISHLDHRVKEMTRLRFLGSLLTRTGNIKPG